MPSAFAPKLGHVLAMVAYPYDPSIAASVPGPPFPIGLPAWPLGYPSLFSYTVPGGTRSVLAATEGFTTAPGDPLPHQWFAPLVADGFNFEWLLFDSIEPGESRGASASGGELRFSDAEGRFDALVRQLGWDGRTVELWRGPRGAAFAAFEKVAVLTCDGWTGLGRASKSMKIRDRKARLYGAPLVGASFAGSGGLDGDAGAKGKLIPWSFGYVFGVEPVVFDTANLLARWHARQVQGVIDLTVGGVSWTDMGDYPDLAALLAAASGWANGQFGTCNLYGVVRYGAVPSHPVRIEGQGDALGGVYADTRGEIVRRIATSCGMLPLRDPAEIDTASFAALETAQPGECGWHWNAKITIGDALDEIMAGVAGWWDVGLDGMLSAAQLEAPADVPDLVLDATQPMPGEPVAEDDAPPRAKTRIGWQRNYAPLSASQLTGAANASLATQQLFAESLRFAQAEQSNVRILHPKATEPDVLANYRDEADAQAEANRQQALFGSKRERWTWPAHIDALAPLRGITVRVDNWDRYAFGGSRSFRSVGLTAGPRAVTAGLVLWG